MRSWFWDRNSPAIVKDLSRLTFIRQSTRHNAPLAAIDININDLTGDSTFFGTWLHLWSINGPPLASVNTLVAGGPDRPFSSAHPLRLLLAVERVGSLSVILTGSTDGVIRM
jgi:hypothetical protein